MFCGELLNNAEALITQGLHTSEIISGYNIAGKKALEILEGKDLNYYYRFSSSLDVSPLNWKYI